MYDELLSITEGVTVRVRPKWKSASWPLC